MVSKHLFEMPPGYTRMEVHFISEFLFL